VAVRIPPWPLAQTSEPRHGADRVLCRKPNLRLAALETRGIKHAVGAGMQQGLECAEMLDVPFLRVELGDPTVEGEQAGGTERREEGGAVSTADRRARTDMDEHGRGVTGRPHGDP